MRRLPVFFLLDCSESMVGDPLRQMQDGLAAIVNSLRSDPHALESVHISVIAFAGVSRLISPLIEISSFYTPQLPLGGGTNLSAALSTLMTEIDSQIRKNTPDMKGDWKPIIYLITDGKPTDDPTAAITKWKKKYASNANLIAIGIGPDADLSGLRNLTENLFHFSPVSDQDFKKFIQWVSASVSIQSKSLGMNTAVSPLESVDQRLISLVKDVPFQSSDNSCVTLVGRCSKTKKPYLIKYVSMVAKLPGLNFAMQPFHYNLAGCFHLNESYFDWTDHDLVQDLVNTSQLDGAPGCPHCGAMTAFAVCACGKLICINGPETVVCPWCEESITFGESGGNNSFDVQRSRG